jgi:hypothetical protein
MSKYGYIGMMERNAVAIVSEPWRKCTCPINEVALTVNKITQTDGVFDVGVGLWTKSPTYTAYMRENYDCFKQGGDAVMSTGTMCGYLGMVAYRFTLPVVNPGAIDELKLMIQRDRYLRSGVRVAIEVNSSAVPSDDWSVIRGERSGMYVTPSSSSGGVTGVASWGFLGQSEVPWLLASRATEGALTVTSEEFAGFADAASAKYLWVYMSIEDMADHWELYSSKEERYYSIEGSASLIASCCDFTFATDAEAPDFEDEAAEEVDFAWSVGAGQWPSAAIPLVLLDESVKLPPVLGRFGSFALCKGVSGLIASHTGVLDLGTLWDIMAKSSGSLLFDTFDRSKAALLQRFGAADEWYSPTQMLRLGGVPCPGGGSFAMMAVFRCCGQVTTDRVSGFSSRFTSQMFLGATMSVVSSGRPEYSRIRMLDDAFDVAKAVGCRISVNVWKSESPAFFGGFANVALQALMANPALFTVAEKSVAGSATESLWSDVVQNDAGVYECTGKAESVTVSATADYLGSVSLADACDAVNPKTELATRALDLTGVSVKPGDVLILAPKVEEVFASSDTPVAYWGLRGAGDAIASRDFSGSYGGVHPDIMFA